MDVVPWLFRTARPCGGELIEVGHPLLAGYLELVAARARRNTLQPIDFDLKVFFSIVDKEPVDVGFPDALAGTSS